MANWYRDRYDVALNPDTQIIATVMSVSEEMDPEIPSIIGASAALCVAGLPFQGQVERVLCLEAPVGRQKAP